MFRKRNDKEMVLASEHPALALAWDCFSASLLVITGYLLRAYEQGRRKEEGEAKVFCETIIELSRR